MGKCRYDLSEDFHSRDCLVCTLDKIRAEIKAKIEKRPWLDFKDRERDRNDAFLEVLDIIDKYKAESEDVGELSDGYHTFNQLYHQRAVLFACIVRQNKNKAWKSFKHSDGKYCFDSNGEWFIVGVDTPQGSYTYHYAKEYWDMFDCQELECGKEWDGHTEEDVTRLLSLPYIESEEEDVIDRAATITEEEVIDCINDMIDGMPSDKCSDWINACVYTVRALKELKYYKEDKHSCECCEYEENAENQIPCADCKHNHRDYFEWRE